METFKIFMLIVAVFTAALGFGLSRGKNSVEEIREKLQQPLRQQSRNNRKK